MTERAGQDWNRLHPLTVLKEVGSLAWALVAVFILDFDPIPQPPGVDWADVDVIGAVLVFGYAVTRYLFTAYRITDRALEVRRGVLVRSFQSMPRDRIQSVGTTTSFIGRLLGVTTVEVSAADAEDITLGFVSEAEGELLRRVLEREAIQPAGSETTPPESLLARLSVKGLVLYALTDSSLLIVGAVLVVGVVVAVTASLYFILVPAIFLLFWPALSVSGLVGFRSWLEGDRIRSEAGLLGRRRSEAPIERVQVVRVSRPPLRRLKKLESVSIVTGDVGVSPQNLQLAGTIAPIAPLGEWRRLAETILGEFSLRESDLRPSARATIRRTNVRGGLFVAISVGAMSVMVVLFDLGWWLPTATALVGAMATALYSQARWRVLGYAYDFSHLLVRRGVVFRRLTLVPIHKVQDVTVRVTFFQRRLGLATVEVDTAGLLMTGSVLAVDLEEQVARVLARHLASVAARIALPDGV